MILELTAVEALRVAHILQSYSESATMADLKETSEAIALRLEVQLDQQMQEYNEAVKSYKARKEQEEHDKMVENLQMPREYYDSMRDDTPEPWDEDELDPSGGRGLNSHI